MQLTRDDLLRAYRTMRTIRVFEERVHAESQAGRVPGSTHLYAGQEAVAVGVCMALDGRDHIVSTHRGHGHSIAKGCEVGPMMAEILGKAMRFGAMFAVAEPEAAGELRLTEGGRRVELHLGRDGRALFGEVSEARFRALAQALKAEPVVRDRG